MDDHEKHLHRRITAAREDFAIRSEPYFKELSRVHMISFKGYLVKDDGNLEPIYTEQGKAIIKSLYDNIEAIKESVINAYKLGEDFALPTITKPDGW